MGLEVIGRLPLVCCRRVSNFTEGLISGFAGYLMVRWPRLARNTANVLTAWRLAVVVGLWLIIFFTQWHNRLLLIFGLNISAYMSDLFDGAFARATKSQSRFGAWLDQIADKLLVLPNAYLAYYLLPLPWLLWGYLVVGKIVVVLVFAIIGADLLLVILRLFAVMRHCHVEANQYGKIKIWLQGSGFSAVYLIIIAPRSFSVLALSLLTGALVFALLSIYGHFKAHWRAFRCPKN